jgi:hypothetical protein
MQATNLANLCDIVRIITKESAGVPITSLHCRAAMDTVAAAKAYRERARPLLAEYWQLEATYQGITGKRAKDVFPLMAAEFEANQRAMADAEELLKYEPAMPELKRRVFEMQRTGMETQKKASLQDRCGKRAIGADAVPCCTV